jgi:carbon storage regulator CsrA
VRIVLVVSRKQGETVVIGDSIRLTVVAIRGNQVRLGVTAPVALSIQRGFLLRRDQNMADLQKLKATILADGVIEDQEVEIIRKELYADGKIDKEEVEFLVALRNEAQKVCPAFEELFFEAIKQNVLTDGVIDAEEAGWLRRMLYADGRIDEREKKFMRQLRQEAKQVSPEFQRLHDECMKG